MKSKLNKLNMGVGGGGAKDPVKKAPAETKAPPAKKK